MRKKIAAILLLLVVLGLLFGADGLTRTAILNSSDILSEGGRFGLEIGAGKRTIAPRMKELGLRRVHLNSIRERNPTNSCHGVAYSSQHEVQVFRDKSWRHGVICVVLRDARVEAISWHFTPIFAK